MKLKKPIHKSRLLAFKDEKLLVMEKVGFRRKYTLPGGTRKERETDCTSLIREVQEEIGVLLENKDLTYFISRKRKPNHSPEIYKHYFITTKKVKGAQLLEPEKFKNIVWIPWYQTLAYLDNEDRSAVVVYCDLFRQEAN